MNEPSLYTRLNPRTKTILFIIALLVIGLALGFLISQISTPYLLDQIEYGQLWKPGPFQLTEEDKNNIILGYSIVVEILSVDIVLLIGLMWIYFDTYQKTKLKYLLGFELFVGVFLIKAVAQLLWMNPLFVEPIRQAKEVIRPLTRNMFGPFGFYFTLLEILAICILIYLSRE
jgi:hypothetical protein